MSTGDVHPGARVAARLTAVWAVAFAALSVFWAAGGTWGADTLGRRWPTDERTAGWVAFLWFTVVLKLAIGALAWAVGYEVFAGRWGQVLRVLAYVGAVIMVGYEGVASLVEHALIVAGVLDVPAGLGDTAARVAPGAVGPGVDRGRRAAVPRRLAEPPGASDGRRCGACTWQ